MRLPQAIACAAVVLAGASTASAQTTTGNVQVDNVTRTVADHTDAFQYFVSQEDCLSTDKFEFPVTLANLSGVQTFEVWIGEGSANCQSIGARNGTGSVAQCTRLGAANGAPEQFMSITISASEIAEAGVGASGCVDDGASTEPQSVGIYFLLIRDPAVDVPSEDTGVWSQTKVDLLGPVAPTNVDATASDGAVDLSYDLPTNATDTKGFRFYCDDGSLAANDTSSTTSTTSTTSATTSTTGAGGDATTSTTGAGGAGGGLALRATGSGGAGGGLTSGGSDTAFSCASTVLVAGEPANPAWKSCGSVDGTTSGEGVAKGLDNGREYAIAVVAIDDLDNVGVLSEVVCATPFEVTDFYEAYVDAGGQAGGGFCGVAMPGADTPWAWCAFGAVVIGGAGVSLVRRRARRGGVA